MVTQLSMDMGFLCAWVALLSRLSCYYSGPEEQLLFSWTNLFHEKCETSLILVTAQLTWLDLIDKKNDSDMKQFDF